MPGCEGALGVETQLRKGALSWRDDWAIAPASWFPSVKPSALILHSPSLKGTWPCRSRIIIKTRATNSSYEVPGPAPSSPQFLTRTGRWWASSYLTGSETEDCSTNLPGFLSVLAINQETVFPAFVCSLQWPGTHSPSLVPRPTATHSASHLQTSALPTPGAKWAFLSYSPDLLRFTATELSC